MKVHFYSNRSFLVFTFDQDRQFSKLIEIMDKILLEYRYPSYYEVINRDRYDK
jgi:hypothetical protein